MKKVVVFSGAGVSAASGIATFRDAEGLWENFNVEDVATPEAWERNPALVLDFYNQRRAQACAAVPNAAHFAIAGLEDRFDVQVITQNVDDLHERAGSSKVLHLHGELTKVRSSTDPNLVCSIGDRPVHLGELCAVGSQLRPHIVWFGEEVLHMREAAGHFLRADRVVVVGTSLQVFPAAGLVEFALAGARKFYIDPNAEAAPEGFTVIKGKAEEELPKLFASWK